MKKRLVLLLPALLSLFSCERALLPLSENVDVTGSLTHDMIVLGDRLEDPYSVDNMTKALESVYPTKAGRVVLDPTCLYMRFLPTSEEQYDALVALGLQLVDHPVDYEIVQEGDYYHDPDVPGDELTWQYSVVPVDFKCPSGIRCELLDRCFISEDSPSTKSDGIDWSAVERESYRLTGNASMLSPETRGGESGTPKGRITVLDPSLGEEPEGVKEVMVSCNTFVKFCNAYTDADGNYAMTKSFSSEPRYRLVFKNRKGFNIGFNAILIPASISTMGKGPATGMDLSVDCTSERKLFCRCVVNNAGYDYIQSCTADDQNMTPPPSNLRLWLFQGMSSSSAPMLQQGAFVEGSLLSQFLGEYAPLLEIFLPDITLGLKGLEDYASIYSAAVHEMAHASHFAQSGKDYWNNYVDFILKSFVTSGFVTYGVGTEEGHGYCEVGEMWAYALQTILYRNRYGNNSVVFGTGNWFSPQILVYLNDRGLSFYKIFAVLTSDVTDKDVFRQKLLSYYPELKSTINQAFGRYN